MESSEPNPSQSEAISLVKAQLGVAFAQLAIALIKEVGPWLISKMCGGPRRNTILSDMKALRAGA